MTMQCASLKLLPIRKDDQFVRARLTKDGLTGLWDLFSEHKIYLSGSYLLPGYTASIEHIPDIDIWIPFSDNSDAAQLIVACLCKFFLIKGYDLPRNTYTSGHRRKSLSYKRIQSVMDRIITFQGVKSQRRKIQLLCLKKEGGRTPVEIVSNFDLTVVQQWYDGSHVWMLPAAMEAMTKNTLRLNTESSTIMNQTFPEWTRTLNRLYKYNSRGYTIDSSVLGQLMRSVIDSLAKAAMFQRNWDKVQRIFQNQLNYEGYIREFNEVCSVLSWPLSQQAPFITLAVRAPGNTLKDVYACVVSLPLEKNQEPMYLNSVNLLGGHACLPKLVEDPDARTVRWLGITHLVCTLVPFPNVCTIYRFPDSQPKIVVDQHAEIHDHIYMENSTVQSYIDADYGNNFVVYIGSHTNTLSRAQLKSSIMHLPCKKTDSADRSGLGLLSLHALVGILLPSGNYYVPNTQLQQVLDLPGKYRWQLVPTSIVWDCSTIWIRSEQMQEEMSSYVGGISANGQLVHTARQIHFLKRLP